MMRRRRLFTAACLASFLLCFTVAVVVVFRYAYTEVVGIRSGPPPQGNEYLVAFGQDGLWIGRMSADATGDTSLGLFHRRLFRSDLGKQMRQELGMGRSIRGGHFLGIYALTGRLPGIPTRVTGVLLANWLVVLVLAVLPAIWLILRRGPWRRAERLSLGLCPQCGYDLRATTARCPECGAPIVSILASPALSP